MRSQRRSAQSRGMRRMAMEGVDQLGRRPPRSTARGARLQFHFDAGAGWLALSPPLDASLVSDEAGRGAHGSFTGAFVGMLAFDTSGAGRAADLGHVGYAPLFNQQLS